MDLPRMKVLVVDDEAPVRGMVAAFLERHKYRAFQACDGGEALRILADEAPPIVVTDVMMPGMDGLELLMEIKKVSPETCVVLMTGHGSEDLVIRAIRNGASNYFNKPISMMEFIYAIGVLADLIRGRRALELDVRKITRERVTIETDNDFDSIYSIIHRLTETVSHLTEEVHSIRIGLMEMICNAIEHGNLNITCEEKQKALEKGTLNELYRARSRISPCRERRVRVDYDLSEGRVAYRVTDEGRGFDWRRLPDPGDPASLLSASGRGIIVTKLYMDEMVYSEKGNEVMIAKNFSSPAQQDPPSAAGD
jgi:DNA-binding response OmpR family regulator